MLADRGGVTNKYSSPGETAVPTTASSVTTPTTVSRATAAPSNASMQSPFDAFVNQAVYKQQQIGAHQNVLLGTVLVPKNILTDDKPPIRIVQAYEPGVAGIKEDLAAGDSIDRIAEVQGVSSDEVRAEMAVAGLTVTKETGPEGSDVQTTTIKDANTGENITYYNDFQHDMKTTVVVKNGKEIRTSRDGFGRTTHSETNLGTGEEKTHSFDPKTNTTTDTVIDAEGRRTETVTVADGKSYDHPIGKDETLWEVWWNNARHNGVAWEKFQADNPQLFANPNRSPDLIYETDVVHIDGGITTTIMQTFNNYTLTTAPDGKVTLTNDRTGYRLKTEVGTPEGDLAGLLLDINPNSKDLATARTNKVVKRAVEMALYDHLISSYGKTAEQKEKATQAAIDKYGVTVGPDGKLLPTQPKSQSLEKQAGVDGAKPQVPSPSGGQWVQVNGQWVDPKVAKAIAAETAAKMPLLELPARVSKARAQLDVYMLDPKYKGAAENAEAMLDNRLAPYGLDWSLKAPAGTLAGARERLTAADNQLDKVVAARAAYMKAADALDQAIQRGPMIAALTSRQKQYGDYAAMIIDEDIDNKDIAAADKLKRSDGVSDLEERHWLKAETVQTEADALLAEYSKHDAKGDKLLADIGVDEKQTVYDEAVKQYGAGTAEAPAGTLKSGEKPVEIDIEGSKLRVAPRVAAAYHQGKPMDAGVNALAINIDGQWKWVHPEVAAAKIDLNAAKDQQAYAIADLNIATKYLTVANLAKDTAKAKEYTEVTGFFGEIGNFASDASNTRAYDAMEEGVYQEMSGYGLFEPAPEKKVAALRDSSSIDLIRPISKEEINPDVLNDKALNVANKELKEAELDRQSLDVKKIDTRIDDLTAEFGKAVKRHGAGTAEAPVGTLKPGEKPVEIDIGGGKLRVAPSVAAAYRQGKPMGASVKAVAIKVSESFQWIYPAAQWQWVHPEVAAAMLELDSAWQQKNTLADRQGITRIAREKYSDLADNPQPVTLDEQSAKELQHKQGFDYLNNQQDQALLGYKLRYQEIVEQKGYDGEFHAVKMGGDLDAEVTRIFDIDRSSEDGRKTRGKVVDEINDIAADDPVEIKAVPLFYVDEKSGTVPISLVEIKTPTGKTRFVDAAGGSFASLDDFINNNRQFDDKGRLVAPRGLDVERGVAGEFEVVQSRKFSTLDKTVEPVVGIITAVATTASFTPLAPVAIPVASAGALYLAGSVTRRQINYMEHGGEWGDRESLMNAASLAATVLPMGASGFRALALRGAGMSRSQAFFGSLGMSRTKDAGLMSYGRYGQMLPSSQRLKGAVDAMRIAPGRAKYVAYGLDAGGLTVGAPLLAISANDLIQHAGEMSRLELTNAILGTSTGLFGTASGARGMIKYYPKTATLADAAVANAPDGSPPTIDQIASFGPKRLRAVSDPQFAALSDAHIAAIPEGRIPGLLPKQIASLNLRQLVALSTKQVRKLTPEQFAILSDEQRNAFTSKQFAAVRPAQLAKLTSKQITALNPDLIAALPAKVIAKLSPDHISALTNKQLATLTPHQIEALTKQQFMALTAAQRGKLRRPFSELTPEQIAANANPDELGSAKTGVRGKKYLYNRQTKQWEIQPSRLEHLISEFQSTIAWSGPLLQADGILLMAYDASALSLAHGAALLVRGSAFIGLGVASKRTAIDTKLGQRIRNLNGLLFFAHNPAHLQGSDGLAFASWSGTDLVWSTENMHNSAAGKSTYPYKPQLAGYFIDSAVNAYLVGDLIHGRGASNWSDWLLTGTLVTSQTVVAAEVFRQMRIERNARSLGRQQTVEPKSKTNWDAMMKGGTILFGVTLTGFGVQNLLEADLFK